MLPPLSTCIAATEQNTTHRELVAGLSARRQAVEQHAEAGHRYLYLCRRVKEYRSGIPLNLPQANAREEAMKKHGFGDMICPFRSEAREKKKKKKKRQ